MQNAVVRTYAAGKPKLISRDDGWYVEVFDGEGIASAGPMTEALALKVYSDVMAEVEASNITTTSEEK